jgi:hypothetical protein
MLVKQSTILQLTDYDTSADLLAGTSVHYKVLGLLEVDPRYYRDKA